MRVEQTQWDCAGGWSPHAPAGIEDAQLVLVFGNSELLEGGVLGEVRRAYPAAHLVGCSTAGEICDTRVTDDSLVVTAVRFEHTIVRMALSRIANASQSREVGAELARALPHEGLRHVFVLSEGLGVNGSDLVRGLHDGLPESASVTGGLSADGDRFSRTTVLWGDLTASGIVGALGLYGEKLVVGFGSLGGWDPFGPERLITRSEGNVLFELDGHPALELYKSYLGEHASGLPATGLLFPMSLRSDESGGVVRTILSVDESQGSMTFAGDMPQGTYARLMKANFDRLVDGAQRAAEVSARELRGGDAELAILISCVGRKLVLKQRIEEEVEAVRGVLGPRPTLTGFYSYGEISPFSPEARCELHNQTMTITTLAEAA